MHKIARYWLIAVLTLLESFLLYISSALSYCPLCSASPNERIIGLFLGLVGVVILLLPIVIGFFAEQWQVAIVVVAGAWFLVILSAPITLLVSHGTTNGSFGLIFLGDTNHLGTLVLSLFLLENLSIIGSSIKRLLRNREITLEERNSMN